MLKELQEIVGHLNFVCWVVAPGRAFFCRLCEAMRQVRLLHHGTRVTAGMSQDLLDWSRFLDGFNRASFWRMEICLGAAF